MCWVRGLLSYCSLPAHSAFSQWVVSCRGGMLFLRLLALYLTIINCRRIEDDDYEDVLPISTPSDGLQATVSLTGTTSVFWSTTSTTTTTTTTSTSSPTESMTTTTIGTTSATIKATTEDISGPGSSDPKSESENKGKNTVILSLCLVTFV